MTPTEIRAELKRRAEGVAEMTAYFVEGLATVDHDEAASFCGACAEKLAGDLPVWRDDVEGDVLRWCEECGVLLDWRLTSEEGAAEAIEHFEDKPPSTPSEWAELLLAVAEIAPGDWCEGHRAAGLPVRDVEPSPLWSRVEALLVATAARAT